MDIRSASIAGAAIEHSWLPSAELVGSRSLLERFRDAALLQYPAACLSMPDMQEVSKRSASGSYAYAFLLSVGLFALHTFVLFELASVITRLHATISKPLDAHLADPAIILICFLALFITHLLEAAAWAAFLRRKAPFASFIESLYFFGVFHHGPWIWRRRAAATLARCWRVHDEPTTSC